MIQLRRNIRLKDMILLPNGERVRVDLDVESHMADLIRAQNEATLAAQEWQKAPEDEEKRDAFYARFRIFLEAIIGKTNFETALAAYDGHVDELCGQLDQWAAEEVVPKIREASARKLADMKCMARKIARRK